MGDIGIDKWYWKMGEHKRRGERIIAYVDAIEKRAEIKKGLFLKEQKADFWEKNHRIPTAAELELQIDQLDVQNYWVEA